MSPSAIFEDSNISQTADCTQIPVVDLQSISSTDAESRRRLADEVYKACTEAGFFYIKVQDERGLCHGQVLLSP